MGLGRSRRDLGWVALATLGSYALSLSLEFHERYVRWLARYEHWELDELPFSLAVLACGLAWYALRRRRDALAELARRERAEAHVNALLDHNRALAQGLIALQESERRALARELHDEFGQGCSAVRVETAWLRRCAADDRAGMLAAAQRADAAAQDLHQLVGDLLRRLRPAELDALGLVAALQSLCESWEERSGVSCVFHHEGPIEGLADAMDIAVYRITQEALTNVMRHARASQVRVQLACSALEGLHLSIQDDGRGMDVGAASRGLGLLGATERAAALGGVLEVQSTLGHGVRLQLQIPLAAAAPAWREAA
ncbi:sensor histidine kinase [Aquabacterium sp.]|uniref:sensor histidine kinase n=1 Tax=Aquabacterium sp. TaxID=1872578 RepID=UPI002D1096F2|nr:sensor histidine kinase [Aquabacterium sp.]HSW06980.1 sensor histidine kinase [Aquabacterium sp.]